MSSVQSKENTLMILKLKPDLIAYPKKIMKLLLIWNNKRLKNIKCTLEAGEDFLVKKISLTTKAMPLLKSGILLLIVMRYLSN